MTPQGLFVGVMAVAMAGALLHMLGGSMLFLIVFTTAPLWWPEVFGYHAPVIAYASSLLMATATLMLAGVPAALVERLTRASEPGAPAMWTWLCFTILFTLAGLSIGRI
jgi:hypothetical protein